MVDYFIPAKEDLGKSIDRKPLPGNEDYIVRIEEIAGPNTKPGWNGRSTTVITPRFAVVSFADGAPVVDIEDNPVPEDSPRWVWKDIELGRYGFTTAGMPSMARQFFLAANGIYDINAAIPSGNTDDLVGKTMIATLLVYTGRDGGLKNKIVAFKPLSRRRGQSKTEVVIESQDIVKAKEDGNDEEYVSLVEKFMNEER